MDEFCRLPSAKREEENLRNSISTLSVRRRFVTVNRQSVFLSFFFIVQIGILVIGITQQIHRRGEHCSSALAEQASFAAANDSNAGIMAAVPDLPLANCPPMADATGEVRDYDGSADESR